LTRLWRLAMDIKDMQGSSMISRIPASVAPIMRKTHQTIRKVTEDIDKRFRFNTAIAAMMELINELYKAKEVVKNKDETAVLKHSLEQLLIMLSPFVPHIADELWEAMGLTGQLFNHPWPEYNPVWAQSSEVTIAVQVNGKLRATIEVPKDAEQALVQSTALSDVNVKRFIENASIRKVIYVPNKIINIIVAAL